MVAIVDYGVGNLFSLTSSFAAIGEEAIATGEPEKLLAADRLILPGVGAFAAAMANVAKGFDVNEDCTVWTIYLREGMKWSDGVPFTSEDCRFFYEDCLLTGFTGKSAWEAVKAADENGVRRRQAGEIGFEEVADVDVDARRAEAAGIVFND